MASKKMVYTNANIKEIINKGITEFLLTKDTILTPSAADVLREHGIAIVQASSTSQKKEDNFIEQNKTDNIEKGRTDNSLENEKEIVRVLINILKNKFAIEDKERVVPIVASVLKIMRSK